MYAAAFSPWVMTPTMPRRSISTSAGVKTTGTKKTWRTPQASSANLLFAGSGYLSQRELYRLGAITTVFNLLVYLLIGTPWFFLITR